MAESLDTIAWEVLGRVGPRVVRLPVAPPQAVRRHARGGRRQCPLNPRPRRPRRTAPAILRETPVPPPPLTKVFSNANRGRCCGSSTKPPAALRIRPSSCEDSTRSLSWARGRCFRLGTHRGPRHPGYRAARDLGAALARRGLAVITGGGRGSWRPPTGGAAEAGGVSVGLQHRAPFERDLNRYVNLGIEFRYFFVRKTMFVKYAEAFIIFPAGSGTLDELFEAPDPAASPRSAATPWASTATSTGRGCWSGYALPSWRAAL